MIRIYDTFDLVYKQNFVRSMQNATKNFVRSKLKNEKQCEIGDERVACM